MSNIISKKTKKAKLVMHGLILLFISAVAFFNSVAFAHGNDEQRTVIFKLTRVPQIHDEVVKARCERIGLKVNNRTNHYKSRKESIKKRVDFMLSRLDEVINRFQVKGYDLTKIKVDKENIANLKDEFFKLHDKTMMSLEDLRISTCNGATREEFESKLNNFKENLKLMRESAKEISAYIRDNLLPHLRELRGNN